MELYVTSGGIREIGELLLDRRSLIDQYNKGTLSAERYQEFENQTNSAIAELWLLHAEGDNPRP
jgi:hypothetical protein